MESTTSSKKLPDFKGDVNAPVFSTPHFTRLMSLAERLPYRQFNVSELALLSGLGMTTISTIKQSADSPFSYGKCTLARLDAWLAVHRGKTSKPKRRRIRR